MNVCMNVNITNAPKHTTNSLPKHPSMQQLKGGNFVFIPVRNSDTTATVQRGCVLRP